MSRIKKIILTLIAYLAAFIAAVCISSFVVNRGTISGELQQTRASLPVLYVKTGGQLINEMHGYTEPVDAGYYRDTLTPVGESKTINLSMDMYDHVVTSASYELYNDQYTEAIESGECTSFENVNAMVQMQILFKGNLYSNREYCLHILLNGEDGTQYHYYTRVRYGSDLKAAEKLKFVLDFNDATFNKDSVEDVGSYLEPSSSASNSDMSLVTLYSSADTVTWGNMEPYRTSEIAIRLKEINTETAAFTLSYTIESSADDLTTFYNVEEYYRLRWTDSKIYLLDFERQMSEDMNLSQVSVANGALRLGIGSQDDISYATYGTEKQQYTYITSNGQLWLYDETNRILTKVYANSDEGHNCGNQDDCDIKVIHADSETGDLYFIVYGYMHSGNYEGREGIMINHFSHGDVMLEELAFIPFDKGFEQMKSGLEQLAYMNSNHEAYLMLEDCVYRVDVSLGRMEKVWDHLNSSNCTASDKGIFVMSEGGNDYGGDKLSLIDLNTGKKQTIDGGGQLVKPLGYAGDDLIYGVIDPDLVKEDATGIIQAPISEVRIVDTQLNEVKKYSKAGDYIMSLTIGDGNISMKLGKAVANGDYTDYEDDGEDYIIRNTETSDSTIYIDRLRDGTRGMQNWLYLGTSDSFVPITQVARYLDPGYDISKTYQASDSVELRYYVYTKGRMAAAFNTIQEAVEYGNTYAGTIMTSHKQILWQRAGRAYIWDLGIDSIDKADSQTGMNQILIHTIAHYEGWDLKAEPDDSKPLFAAMTESLPTETIDLSGLELTDVLHFVYRDRLVAVKISDSDYALITAYDTNNISLADPKTGEITTMSQTSAEALFEQYGRVYYSYMD